MSSPLLLTVNAGSGTIKTALFSFGAEPREIARSSAPAADPSTAIGKVLAAAKEAAQNGSLTAIGHRIVHGGPTHDGPVRLTADIVAGLQTLVAFAPNHLPEAIALIRALADAYPGVPQVGCFDTAFHANLPQASQTLPVPARFRAQGVRRYGFHGLSCRYVIAELGRAEGDAVARGRLEIAHLGNGSSVTATHDGRSQDTTMGFTPLGGVIMATRSGDLDPGALTYIAQQERWTPLQLEAMCSRECGLKAIAGDVGDMQTLLARESSDPGARLAVEMYVISVAKAIAGAAVALGGLDGLVFTGGIGEHSATIRDRVCGRLGFLRVPVRVIPADEEAIIARDTVDVLKGSV